MNETRNHGKVFPLGWLRSQACLTKEGVSVAGIRRALSQVSMDSGAFLMSLSELEVLSGISSN